jgi:hypothetical protein
MQIIEAFLKLETIFFFNSLQIQKKTNEEKKNESTRF